MSDLVPSESYIEGYTAAESVYRGYIERGELVEVKRGRWKRPFGAPRCSYRYQCSQCGEIAYQVNGNCGRKDKSELAPCTYRFCPNCGARMKA